MAVVLTGDVHHRIPSGDRRHATDSESALAVEYATIARRHGLRTTLFLTGRAVADEADDSRPLVSMDNVEIGGHGWDAFQPRKLYAALRRVSGSPHGPGLYQRYWTIRRTCTALERFTGAPIRSWRNHAYTRDRRTPVLLAQAGISAWSDEVDLERGGPYLHESGLVVLPMNTLPDHEHVFHGDLTPEVAQASSRSEVYPAAEWLERVCRQTESIVSAGGVATILAHPLCMKVADEWATFEQLCSFLAQFPSLFAAEAASIARSGGD